MSNADVRHETLDFRDRYRKKSLELTHGQRHKRGKRETGTLDEGVDFLLEKSSA